MGKIWLYCIPQFINTPTVEFAPGDVSALVKRRCSVRVSVWEQMGAESLSQVVRLMPGPESLQHLSAVPFLPGWRTKHAVWIMQWWLVWLKALLNTRHHRKKREREKARKREGGKESVTFAECHNKTQSKWICEDGGKEREWVQKRQGWKKRVRQTSG